MSYELMNQEEIRTFLSIFFERFVKNTFDEARKKVEQYDGETTSIVFAQSLTTIQNLLTEYNNFTYVGNVTQCELLADELRRTIRTIDNIVKPILRRSPKVYLSPVEKRQIDKIRYCTSLIFGDDQISLENVARFLFLIEM